MKLILGAGLCALACLVLACSGDDDSGGIDAAEPTTTAETTTETTTSTQPPTPAPTSTPAPPTATPTEEQELEILESGFVFRTNTASGGFNVSWLAVVHNPSTNAAEEVRVTALFYDAANILVGTTDQNSPVVFGGMTTALGNTFAQTTGEPARMELRLGDVRFTSRHQATGFPVEGVIFITQQFSSQVRATITNSTAVDLEDLHLVCSVKDAVGNYIAIGSTFYDLLPLGATATADCAFFDDFDTGAVATAQFYVAISNLTALALND